MHTIGVEVYGGTDWHDSTLTQEYLQEGDDYHIVNDIFVKAYYIAQVICSTIITMEDGKGSQKIVGPSCTFSISEIEDFLRAGKSFSTDSLPAGENAVDSDVPIVSYDAKTDSITVEIWNGVYRQTHSFIVKDIPDDKVRYLVVENFLVPHKGVPSVDRAYHPVFCDLKEAKEHLREMPLHEEYRSVKEIAVVNVDEIEESRWYKKQLAVIEAEAEYREAVRCGAAFADVPDRDLFAIFPEYHVSDIYKATGVGETFRRVAHEQLYCDEYVEGYSFRFKNKDEADLFLLDDYCDVLLDTDPKVAVLLEKKERAERESKKDNNLKEVLSAGAKPVSEAPDSLSGLQEIPLA